MFKINRKKINDNRNQFGWDRYFTVTTNPDAFHYFGWNPPQFIGEKDQIVSGFVYENLTIPPTEYIWKWTQSGNSSTYSWVLLNKYIYTDQDNYYIKVDNILFALLVIGMCFISLWMVLAFIYMLFI